MLLMRLRRHFWHRASRLRPATACLGDCSIHPLASAGTGSARVSRAVFGALAEQSCHFTFDMELLARPVLISRGGSAIRASPYHFSRELFCIERSSFCQRNETNGRHQRALRRRSWVQIFQLSRRCGRKAQPIYHLVAPGFSYAGFCHFARCSFGTDRRNCWNWRSAIERALHHLSFAISVRRANAPCLYRAGGRRRFLRKLSRHGPLLVARTHARRLELCDAR